MRKYFLTILTFTLHNHFNVGEISEIYNTFETEKEKKEVTTTKQNYDDSISYIRKNDIHTATWYNPHGARTASGLKFHKDSLTAAYNFSKMGSYLRVVNIYDSSSIIVKVTDRMGNKSKNHIDLSKCAFDSIGNPKSGKIKVFVEEVIK